MYDCKVSFTHKGAADTAETNNPTIASALSILTASLHSKSYFLVPSDSPFGYTLTQIRPNGLQYHSYATRPSPPNASLTAGVPIYLVPTVWPRYPACMQKVINSLGPW